MFKDKLQSESDAPLVNYNILRRSIYIVGLFMRYFDFSDPAVYGANCTVGKKLYFYFVSYNLFIYLSIKIYKTKNNECLWYVKSKKTNQIMHLKLIIFE